MKNKLFKELVRSIKESRSSVPKYTTVPICAFCKQSDCETGVSGCGKMKYSAWRRTKQ